jgi:hypothetical protein
VGSGGRSGPEDKSPRNSLYKFRQQRHLDKTPYVRKQDS